jgi:hypothetical protein
MLLVGSGSIPVRRSGMDLRECSGRSQTAALPLLWPQRSATPSGMDARWHARKAAAWMVGTRM